jgi:hypothetical protein
MRNRLKKLGFVMLAIGVAFLVAGVVAYTRVQDGYGSLQAFSEEQNVTLSYNEDGQLTDRGTTEGADAIMILLTEDWQYPVVTSDLDPSDPLVNTATEYMYQMATISHHVLDGTVEVVLTEDVEYNGESFEAGVYEVATEGKYWTDFDRLHPLEGPARAEVWTGTVHGLVGELGVGTVTHSTLQMGLALSALFAGLGLTFMLLGGGVAWAMTGKLGADAADIPNTVPEAFIESEVSDTTAV